MSERALGRDAAARTYALCLRFFSELTGLGVAHVVVSPGSRSTPLTLSAAATSLKVTVRIDERVAAFCALGIAKATGVPAVLICSSGTAVANHLPAVIEANHAGVPLIVCSGDRPPELRGWGAGQTIDQPRIFGTNTRWSTDVASPAEADEDYGARLALRAFEAATNAAGPVHLNWPLRKPLDPVGDIVAPQPRLGAISAPIAGSGVLGRLGAGTERGLIVVGPNDLSDGSLAQIAAFSLHHAWPVVADPASGMRFGPWAEVTPLVATADLICAHPEVLPGPDVVVRIGSSPTSAALERWLEAAAPDKTVLVDPGTDWSDPHHRATDVLRGDVRAEFATNGEPRSASPWRSQWTALEASAAAMVESICADNDANEELAAVRSVIDALKSRDEPGTLMVSSSMPIRVVDAISGTASSALRIRANRGANGIDGIIATADGMATAGSSPVTVLIGDVATVHDLGALAAVDIDTTDLVIVVIDNGGGRIFEMLPVVDAIDRAAFDRLFITAPGIDLVAVAVACGWNGSTVTVADIADAVTEAGNSGGCHFLVVPVTGGDATVRALEALRARVVGDRGVGAT